LDIRNRGVGKEWCTDMDWASFSVLPNKVLDSLLIGSTVNYPDVDGQTVEGVVTGRIGGGLYDEIKWRVEIGREKRKGGRPRLETTVYAHEDLTAGALREAIIITDSNVVRTRRLLKNTVFAKRRSISLDDGDQKQTNEDTKQNRKLNIQSAEAWADHRLKEYNLVQISDDEKTKRKKSCNKVDDCIIQLSTGVGIKNAKRASADSECEDEKVDASNHVSISESEPGPGRRGRKRKISFDNRGDASSSLMEEKKDDHHVQKKQRRSAAQDASGSNLRRSSRSKGQT